MSASGPRIEHVGAAAYVFPLDVPEADGTLRWDSVSLVVVHLECEGERGLGYSYTAAEAAEIVRRHLAAVVEGASALAPEAAWYDMLRSVRNLGHAGVVANAISAVDVACWDLKAKLLGLALVDLLGPVRDAIPVYGSGGFTSLRDEELRAQLGGWADQGMMRVKMKVGRDPDEDVRRVAAAREAVGEEVELFVDANGAYRAKQALQLAERFVEQGVTWFEEPVSSDDLDGLRFVRERCSARLSVSAGEYGYDPWYFRRMLEARAVDVIQPDATRCLGVTGYLKVAALAEGFHCPISSHTAASIHVHLGCALSQQVHAEWFHDHANIEAMLFEGTPELVTGTLRPSRKRPGLGIALKRQEAARFAA